MVYLRTHLHLLVLCVLVVTNSIIWYAVFAETPSGTLTVAFLDVGQGDALFVESPVGNQLLIDGGSNSAVLRGLGRSMPFYDRSIDVVLATHPDADHVGGLVEVLERFQISTVVESGNESGTSVARTFSQMREQENAHHVIAQRGQVIDLGGGAHLTILFPDRDVSTVESNTASIVAQISYGKHKFLLTGDAPKAIERYLVSLDGEHLASTVLKAGHHGSHTSSDESFIGFAGPDYVVISAGCDNRYGHPHEEVLETLARFETEILSTCERGTTVFETDGRTLTMK